MLPLFIGITALNLLALTLTVALGYGVSSGRDLSAYHQLAGALATILCCGVHCIVFTYFIATAKWVQHAVTVKQLHPELIAPTRSFKAQAFPAAILAMLTMAVAAFVGAATFAYQLLPLWHHSSALIALATNVLSAAWEYRAIASNAALIDRILAMINASAPVAERQTQGT